MKALKEKISEVEKLEARSVRISKALESYEQKKECSKARIFSGDLYVYDKSGNNRLDFNVHMLFSDSEIAAALAKAKLRADGSIQEIEPILKMAEMAFKGMEK